MESCLPNSKLLPRCRYRSSRSEPSPKTSDDSHQASNFTSTRYTGTTLMRGCSSRMKLVDSSDGALRVDDISGYLAMMCHIQTSCFVHNAYACLNTPGIAWCIQYTPTLVGGNYDRETLILHQRRHTICLYSLWYAR